MSLSHPAIVESARPDELPAALDLAFQYLRHDLDRIDVSAPRLRWQSYRSADREFFHKTLQFTYDGSLDCPELNGVRTIEEVVAGHIAQGQFDPDRWWLAWLENQPAG